MIPIRLGSGLGSKLVRNKHSSFYSSVSGTTKDGLIKLTPDVNVIKRLDKRPNKLKCVSIGTLSSIVIKLTSKARAQLSVAHSKYSPLG